jgi:subtilisin family serine protease
VSYQFHDLLGLAVLTFVTEAVLKIMEKAGFAGSSALGGIWTPPYVERLSSANFRSVRYGDKASAARPKDLTRRRDEKPDRARDGTQPLATTVDTLTRAMHPSLAWPLQVTGLEEAVATLTGEGVPVGLIDSGVNNDHFAVAGRVASFAVAELNGASCSVTERPVPFDRQGHGTMVASVLKGHDASGAPLGLAPRCELHVVSVTRASTLQWNDLQLVAALEWLARKKVRLVNISLDAGTTPIPGHELVFTIARHCNMLPIVAIGNSGCGNPTTPGRASTALSIGAMEAMDRVAGVSGCGAISPTQGLPKLLAPAPLPVAVTTASMHSIVESEPLTSFATPFVTGLAALLLQVCPSATVDQLEAALLAPTGTSLARSGCTACPGTTPVVNFKTALAKLREFGVCTGEHLL